MDVIELGKTGGLSSVNATIWITMSIVCEISQTFDGMQEIEENSGMKTSYLISLLHTHQRSCCRKKREKERDIEKNQEPARKVDKTSHVDFFGNKCLPEKK